ncbi:MAG TPA: hypothetical protein VFI25_14345 [Planctomycetota bacterium]|nr:hypothetical protein [Planctomycetota bacterium]
MRPLPATAAALLLFAAQDTGEFSKRFSDAFAVADAAEMRKAVAAYPDAAVLVFFEKARAFAETEEAPFDEQMKAIAKAWREAMGETFLENEYKFVGLLDSDARMKRGQLIDLMNEGRASAEQARKEEGATEEAQEKLVRAARGLDELKDLYHAALAYHTLGGLFDPTMRPKTGEARKAVDLYRKALERYEAVDYRGPRFKALKALADGLAAAARDAEKAASSPASAPAGPGGAPGGKPPDETGTTRWAPGSEWVSCPLAFGVLGEGESAELPSYEADDVTPSWMEVLVRGNPNKEPAREKMNFFDPPVFLVREKAAKYTLDVDGNGTGDVPVKFGKDAVEFTRKGAAGETRVALRLATLGEQVTYLRTLMNLAPAQDSARVKYRSVGFLGGELLGQPIRIFDLNCDGKYGGDPLAISTDAIDGETDPSFDGVQVGRGKVGPASSIVEVGGKLYRLRLEGAGGKPVARAREIAVPTATLKLEFRGLPAARPNHLIVRETGEFSGSFFDLAASPKGVTVPAGTYEIAGGLLRTGRGPATQKASVLKGKATPFKVAAGETKGVTIGRPYQFDFQVAKSTIAGETRYTIQGKFVAVYGAGGERYERIWDEVPVPEVTWRKAGAKGPAGKGTEMKRATDDDVKRTEGFAVLWHPLDLEIPAPGPGDWQFRLAERHKLFGDVASEWK